MRPGTGRRTGRRTGGTIVVVLLLLLAMQVLAQAALVAALAELSATRSGAAYVQARAAAEGGVRAALSAPPAPTALDVPVGTRTVLLESGSGRVRVRVAALRASREAWLIEGTGTVEGRPGRVLRRRWVWVLDALQRVAGAGAVVRTAGRIGEATRSRIEPEVLPLVDRTEPVCRPWFQALDSLLASRVFPRVAYDSAAALAPSLGLLDTPMLLSMAPQLQRDSVRPVPTERPGRCDTGDPDNWGDPTRRGSRCSDHHTLRSREGDLRMVGGVGQGILAVTGDLTMERGAHFAGVLLVGGVLRLHGGAVLEGLVQVGQGVEVDNASILVGSACAAVRALHAFEPTLVRFVSFPLWGWIGPN